MDVGEGIGIIGQPGVDADPPYTDRDDRETRSVIDRRDLGHAGDRPHRAALVATAHLAAAFDQDHPELVVLGLDAVDHELAVPGLEHVQREDLPG